MKLSISNYIYTDKGIYSMTKLNELYAAQSALPKVMTFDVDELSANRFSYSFVDVDNILEVADTEIYECKFVDVYSGRTIVVNCSSDTQIYQYNTLQTDVDPIINVNFKVVQYLVSNVARTKLVPQWKELSGLLNYGTKMTNICLGDTVMKFSNKRFLNTETAYTLRDASNGIIPVFACLTNSTYYNMVLVK